MNTDTTCSFISCRVGDLLIGIDLARVQEINRLVDATFVPRLEPEVKGLINLRGNLVTVLDLVRIVHERDIAPVRETRNVIVEHHQERFGLLVDAVGDVADCDGAVLEPLPSHLDALQAQWFKGLVQLQQEILLVLDVDAVVQARETDTGHA
jgi:purine-binding chemotaxis protein CheW